MYLYLYSFFYLLYNFIDWLCYMSPALAVLSLLGHSCWYDIVCMLLQLVVAAFVIVGY